MANLVQTGQPYLHMSSYTFVNYLSKTYKANSRTKNLVLDTTALDTLIEQAETVENRFYNDFKVGSAAEWSDKYLARETENADRMQIASSVWNSKAFRNKLYGLMSDEKIIRNVESKLGDYLAPEMRKELEESKNLEVTVQKILTSLLVQLDPKTKQNVVDKDLQKKIRIALGDDIKNMRSLKTGSTVIPKLMKNLMYENASDLKKKAQECYLFLRDRVKEKIGEISPKELDELLREFKIVLETNTMLLAGKETDITGEVQEQGDVISLRFLLNQDSADPVKVIGLANQKVERLYSKNKVKTKIDMEIYKNNNVYRFQQKNTNKDIFSEFEAIGQKSLNNHSLFFDAQSALNLTTFRQQVERIFGGNSSLSNGNEQEYLDLLEYLLVNINALNKNYQATAEKRAGMGGRLYKKEPEIGSSGVYPRFALKLLSDIVSQYCLIFFSDIMEEAKKIQMKSYQFVIFNGRILIPMSTIYRGFRDNLTSTAVRVDKEATYLDMDTAFPKGFNYSQTDYDNMVDKKIIAVKDEGGFDRTKNYENGNLVEAGTEAGSALLPRIKIGKFISNVNLASLIPQKFA